jgi:hypothetical protein
MLDSRGIKVCKKLAHMSCVSLQFVEGGLVYRLPWAMEAIRVRAIANADPIGDLGLHLDDFELGLAVPAVETGTLNRSASILIQAGFNSRLAAIKVVTDTGAAFSSGFELQLWLASDVVAGWSAIPDWPTAGRAAILVVGRVAGRRSVATRNARAAVSPRRATRHFVH